MVDGARHIKSNKVTRSVLAYSAVKRGKNSDSSSHGLRTPNEGAHKSQIFEKLGRCGRQNMLRPYLKIWDWVEFSTMQWRLFPFWVSVVGGSSDSASAYRRKQRWNPLWETKTLVGNRSFCLFFYFPGSFCGCQNKVLIRKLGMNLLFWIEIFPK